MGILSTTFGSASGGVEVFGGLWFIVAFFILGFFVLMLLSQKTSAENIGFFILTFFLLVISNGLFAIPVEYIVTMVVFIVMFISFYAYNIFNKTD
jgi:hypothetical protein